MPENVGTKTRSSASDDFPMSFDWSNVDVFGTNAVSSCTVTVTAITGTVPTIGAVTVAVNVATFRVSGGTAGDSILTFTATNGASPPNVVSFTGTLKTL